MPDENATFYAFKESGKYYSHARGHLSKRVFQAFDRDDRRRLIVDDNGGCFPGLNGPAVDFVFVVVADDSVDYGYPLMLYPRNTRLTA